MGAIPVEIRAPGTGGAIPMQVVGIDSTLLNVANGIAGLDANAQLAAAQMPAAAVGLVTARSGGAIVVPGLLDVTQTADGDAINTGSASYSVITSPSLNACIMAEGCAVVGVRIGVTSKEDVSAIAFAVLRFTAGTTYTIVGLSQEVAAAALTVGVNAIYFDTPITGVRSDDRLALLLKHVAGGMVGMAGLAAESDFVIADSTIMSWNIATHETLAQFAVGESVELTGTFVDYFVPMSPLIQAPKVLILGDSIAAGASTNSSWLTSTDNKVRSKGYLQLVHQSLGNSYINLANRTGSDNLQEVLADLITYGPIYGPQVVHVHCMFNDIVDSHSWATYAADVLALRNYCLAHNWLLILSGPAPTQGGNKATILTWAASLRALCQASGIVHPELLASMAAVDGSALNPAWMNADGIHLTAAGDAMAAAAVTRTLRAVGL